MSPEAPNCNGVHDDGAIFIDAIMSSHSFLSSVQVKRIIWQLLSAMAYMHENWVLHRDLKPANILYDHLGNVKICDFGLARRYGSPVHPMTPLVVTRNYRAPEIPLGVRQ